MSLTKSETATKLGTRIETMGLPTDNLFDDQWYIVNQVDTPRVDLNVRAIWDEYTGEGVKVGIYDSGVQYTHSDLAANYDSSLHVTLSGSVHDPMPNTNRDSPHGTSVAGIIASVRNGTGTVGVAYDARIAGVNIFGLNDADFEAAMRTQARFDVTNHSWGFVSAYADDVTNPYWQNFFSGISYSANNGRDGLGTVMVVAAGNGRESGDDANTSGFINSRYTIGVAATERDGDITFYSTPGASVLISAPVDIGQVTTTDFIGSAGYSSTDYTSGFAGTSAATPMITGVVALILEANPDLGWRDVQAILAASARHTGSAVGATPEGYESDRWAMNGADSWNGGGMHFSNDYGFGLVDARAAVRLAESWTLQSTSSNEAKATGTNSGYHAIPDANPRGVTFSITLDKNVAIESIALDLDIDHTYAGDLIIELTSPSGTTSRLVWGAGGSTDLSGWIYSSNAFRGEDSKGTWTVNIVDTYAADSGAVNDAKLTAYGSGSTRNDLYIYTDEYSLYAGESGRSTIRDTDGGVDTINVAAVNSKATIDLAPGATGSIDNTSFRIADGTVIENAIGGEHSDRILGNGRANRLWGMDGDDTIGGRGGDDRIDGKIGDDRLLGSLGNDTLRGAVGKDDLYGGVGNDRLVGNLGTDTLSGGGGNDTLLGGRADDVLDGLTGRDSLRGGDDNDTLRGGAGNDFLSGENGSDRVNGGSQDDLLFGVGGRDTLLGGLGDDTINGGAHNDLLWGGKGNDIFVFGTNSGDDRIGDFGTGNDKIDLSAYGIRFRDLSISVSGGNTTIDIDGTGNSIVLVNHASGLDAGDFLF
ncbi:MAG: furin [Hyphomicrobiales bacterium]|nr:MAG: furin [Hyphomicrobiales bacterium]